MNSFFALLMYHAVVNVCFVLVCLLMVADVVWVPEIPNWLSEGIELPCSP